MDKLDKKGLLSMISETKKDRVNAEKLIRIILQGAGFSGFRLDTNFNLKFDRSEQAEFNGHELPWIFEIQILGDWWIGSKEEWRRLVEIFDSIDSTESEEPIKSFELTRLRWTEGATIDSIDFYKDYFTINFKNKKSLSISCVSDEDYSWIIKEPNIAEVDSLWSIVCESSDFYIRSPL